MASLTADDKVHFLLHLLANSDFKPNYQTLAVNLGINSAGNAQRRFKSIVEANKSFSLTSNKDSVKVVSNESESGISTPPKKKRKASTSPKKRKRAEEKDEDEDSMDETSTETKVNRRDEEDAQI